MPRQANGNYLPPANTAAVTLTAISSTAYNTLETDIGTEITNSVDRGGRSAMTANLPMGGQKITGMADPTVATDGATKNYVDTTTAAFFSTGDVKPTLKVVADSGWLLFDDGTFGSASSGSSNSNNAANQALFTLLFNNVSDTAAPILTSGGGATTRASQVSASAAWAANCRMSLPKAMGRAFGGAGSGSGLTARPLGSNAGADTVVLTTVNLPPYTPAGSVSVNSTLSDIVRGNPTTWANGTGGAFQAFNPGQVVSQQIASTGSLSGTAQGGTSTPVSIVQASVFVNWMVKL